MSKNPDYKKAYADLAGPLTELSNMLPPGYKTTFFARRPGEPQSEVIMTEDDLKEVAARLLAPPPVVIKREAQK